MIQTDHSIGLVLPACAGVIPSSQVLDRSFFSITRMRGGDPVLPMDLLNKVWYYPHARG